MAKVVLYGYGMVVPRLGEPYTLTIQSAEIFHPNFMEELELPQWLQDNEEGRKKLGELLGRKTVLGKPTYKCTLRFTHTFSKVTALEDTGKPGGENGVIQIKGISPKIGGFYVEAEIGYPSSYNPPTVI